MGRDKEDVAIIGAGYVGLATGVGLASLGHRVSCVDVDPARIDSLMSGVVPISEPAISDVLPALVEKGAVSFTASHEDAVSTAGVVFLCVPTPQSDDGSVDLAFIESAAKDIAPWLRPYAVVVNKSTVPVGTARRVKETIGRDDVHVVSNPEFLRQGSALEDFLSPSRIVVGGENRAAVEKVIGLYSGVDAPVIATSSSAAEVLKYAANSFLATKLTFINAIADICEAVGADVLDVIEGLGYDSRIGSEFLNPGPGWGGSCFPKDTRALVSIAQSYGYDFSLLRGVIATNDGHYDRIAQKIRDACGGSVAGKVVAAWGLTFKAHTDDLRDSPSVAILSQLVSEGAVIRAYDPAARAVETVCPWATRAANADEAARGSDVLAVLTEWPEFRKVDPAGLIAAVSTRTVVDGRNILDREQWIASGFNYRGVGR